MRDVILARESPHLPEVAELLRGSDAYSRALYPPESSYLIDPDQLARPEVRFFVARIDGAAVGCGAVVIRGGGFGELKRIFVADAARGRGVGQRLLSVLETAARAEGVHTLQLETGPLSHPALALYHRNGYRERGPFADYPEDPMSVFMEKRIG
ncbi:GNAT family N-acetyltransferase [Stella sp.]|uniref:GNAT family N-acetyltransferase n=1 Tax=Stella sp. TaxID=2912054 RepID=UPI0035B3B4D9